MVKPASIVEKNNKKFLKSIGYTSHILRPSNPWPTTNEKNHIYSQGLVYSKEFEFCFLLLLVHAGKAL